MKNSDFGMKDYHETNIDDVWKTFEMIHQNSKDFQLFSSVCKILKNLEKCKKMEYLVQKLQVRISLILSFTKF
jgi:hypothetical protein